jgi:hypothetical protein
MITSVKPPARLIFTRQLFNTQTARMRPHSGFEGEYGHRKTEIRPHE